MVNRMRVLVILALALCLGLTLIHPGVAQRGASLSALILNGDFEGAFLAYGDNGAVAQYWQAYDLSSPGGAPQFKRSTWILLHGQASQMFWKDHGLYNAGIMQVIGGAASPAGVRITANRTFTAHVWMYSVYEGASAAKQPGKILKRIGIDPYGGTNPQSSSVIWTPETLYGQDKEWVRLDCKVEARASQITLFIEGKNLTIGGQDQVFLDDVTLDEEGVSPATPTPQWTATPTPTPTPMIDVVRTVSVGHQPKGIAVMPELNRFLVANSGDNSVSRLEGFLDWRQSSFSSNGERPSGVATDPDRCLLYVSNTGSNSVSVFNVCGSANQPAGTIALGEGRRPDGIAVLTTTNTIYVANAGANSVSVINGATLAVSKEIQVGPLPGQIAVNPKTNKVYVTSRGYPAENDGSVAVIDGNTQNVLKTIGLSYSDPVPAPEAYGVAVNPATNRVYVATASGKLVIIDGASDNVLRAITPPNAVGLSSVAVNPRSNNVYVASAAGNLVFVYDAGYGRWLRTLTIGGGQIGGIAVNPLTFHVLVSNTGQNTVSVIRDYGWYQPYRIFLPITIKR